MVKFYYVEDEIEKEKTITPVIRNDKIETIDKSIKTKKTKAKISGDKSLSKDEIISYITNLLHTNNESFTLDFLRGQKLVYDSINELRK